MNTSSGCFCSANIFVSSKQECTSWTKYFITMAKICKIMQGCLSCFSRKGWTNFISNIYEKSKTKSWAQMKFVIKGQKIIVNFSWSTISILSLTVPLGSFLLKVNNNDVRATSICAVLVFYITLWTNIYPQWLTYFSQMFHFYTPWNILFSNVFRSYRNETLIWPLIWNRAYSEAVVQRCSEKRCSWKIHKAVFAYSSSLLREIIARNHMLLQIFSNLVYFCPNFQIFCPFLSFFWKFAVMALLSRIGTVKAPMLYSKKILCCFPGVNQLVDIHDLNWTYSLLMNLQKHSPRVVLWKRCFLNKVAF